MESKKTLYPITEDFLKNYTIDYPPLIPLYRDYHIQEEYDNNRPAYDSDDNSHDPHDTQGMQCAQS